MRVTQFIAAILGLLVISVTASCQPRRMHEGRGRNPERLERFKTMRLVEILKLSEEDAARLASKQSTHEDKMHELMKSRNDAIDDLAEASHPDSGKTDIAKRIAEVSDLDQKIFAERRRYQDELQKLLTKEQFAKFLVFERNFGRNVRDAMRDMHPDR
jgi:Spy/CpxP family protein refolding chaperone